MLNDPFQWFPDYFENKETGGVLAASEMDDVYLVWGANTYNYNYRAGKVLGYVDRITGEKKKGSGQAGPKGPTKGKAHPRFVGVVSIFKPGDTLKSVYAAIDERFTFLKAKMAKGSLIVFPLDANVTECVPEDMTADFAVRSHGLGKGVARDRLKTKADIQRWEKIQTRIEKGIRSLFD